MSDLFSNLIHVQPENMHGLRLKSTNFSVIVSQACNHACMKLHVVAVLQMMNVASFPGWSNGPGNEASDEPSVGVSRIANVDTTPCTNLHQTDGLPSSSWLCLYSFLAWQRWQEIVTTGARLVIPDPCSTGLGTDNEMIFYAGFRGWEWDQQ